MVSASSRPRSATRNPVVDHLSLLLQSKAGIEPVTEELIAAADKLRKLGLITFDRRSYVRCALTEDLDFPRSNRTCTGRVFLSDHLDENDNDYRCPDCSRLVYPERSRKRTFDVLSVKVIDDAVGEYVGDALGQFDAKFKPVDGVPFAWRIENGLAGVHVCIADFCDHQQLMSAQWAQTNPTCYVFVNSRAVARFANIAWISKVSLADMVGRQIDLAASVQSLATNQEPRELPAMATPVYSKGAHRTEVIHAPYEVSVRLFVLEIGNRTASVNGVEVVAAQAKAARTVLLQLARTFTDNMLAGLPLDDYRCLTPGDIADEIQVAEDPNDALDADMVRRTINRLQKNIEKRLRGAGIATESNSVIQVSPNMAKEGYRLNPHKVALRPLNPPSD